MNASGGMGGWVAGADGCRAGWVVVLRERRTGALRARVAADFETVLAAPERPAVVGVDIPIGLIDAAVAGGRACDALARRLLGARSCTIFSAPTRPALEAYRAGRGYRQVSRANRGGRALAPGLSRQAFHLLAKIDEVDRLLPAARCTVVEVHPELSFGEANGGTPLADPKRTAAGRSRREALLGRLGYSVLLASPGVPELRGARHDDLLDACIACWSAERVAAGTASFIPPAPPTDRRGLPMAIWR